MDIREIQGLIRRREGGCLGAWEGRMWVTVGRWVGRRGGGEGGGGVRGKGRVVSCLAEAAAAASAD